MAVWPQWAFGHVTPVSYQGSLEVVGIWEPPFSTLYFFNLNIYQECIFI